MDRAHIYTEGCGRFNEGVICYIGWEICLAQWEKRLAGGVIGSSLPQQWQSLHCDATVRMICTSLLTPAKSRSSQRNMFYVEESLIYPVQNHPRRINGSWPIVEENTWQWTGLIRCHSWGKTRVVVACCIIRRRMCSCNTISADNHIMQSMQNSHASPGLLHLIIAEQHWW